MRIEIVCTGDEVLTGKIINSNFSHISQKLEDAGLAVHWGTVVGDDRQSLLDAFQQAAARADAVIVNGGLGPTIDDLSQEIAARAAGVELVLNEDWLAHMTEFFRQRSRTMSVSNRKQAMLPAGAELLDNPIGTACGFALDIGKARFFFTPGVPRELHRMLAEQIVPRLQDRAGVRSVIHLKRFHSYGIGESHADTLLAGIETLVPGGVKLGFRAHYPQLETKLLVRGADLAEVERKLAPAQAMVRQRLGTFILAEDDNTLEGVVLAALAGRRGSLALVEGFTGGLITTRMASLPGAEAVFHRSIVARDLAEIAAAVGLDRAGTAPPLDADLTVQVAEAARAQAGTSHALAVLVEVDDGADRIDFGGTVFIAIAHDGDTVSRRARLVGGRDWLRLGAAEMGLDCLRRHLQRLPVKETIDFEKA